MQHCVAKWLFIPGERACSKNLWAINDQSALKDFLGARMFVKILNRFDS